MSEGRDSLLDRAETFARRVLERLGSKVDDRASSPSMQTLSPRELGEVTSKLEKAIESNLREDANSVKRLAPNVFQVLFPYEVASRLNTSYTSALADELRAAVFEYINNRRYETRGPVRLTTSQDLFAKQTVVKSYFEGEAPGAAGVSESANTTRAVKFASEGGQVFSVALKAGEGPAYIGRAAGAALRIDDSSISRLHCSLSLRQNGELVISDLGSSNGTMVNGEWLDAQQAKPLAEGDSLVVGDVRLKVLEIC